MPFDLEAPAKVLTPKYSPFGARRPVTTEVILGLEGDGTIVRRFAYPDGEVTYRLTVNCLNAPHCHYCECDTNHYVVITEEQVTALRKLLEK